MSSFQGHHIRLASSLVVVSCLLTGLFSCSTPGTHTVFLQYHQPAEERDFSSLTVGLAPVEDPRRSPLTVGRRIRPDGREEAILLGTPAPSEDLLLIMRRYLEHYKIHVVDLLAWSPDPRNLKDLPEEVQLAVLGRIDALDVQAESTLLKTSVQYRVVLTAFIGFRQRGEVVTRTIEVSPKKTFLGFRLQDIENDLNEALREALALLFEGILGPSQDQ
jgi:hypothetical protein